MTRSSQRVSFQVKERRHAYLKPCIPVLKTTRSTNTMLHRHPGVVSPISRQRGYDPSSVQKQKQTNKKKN
uniref:Uncharacterized protein n=1 Tax=Anguilla anguilla TaxID=7936 RepID=A0A0E9T9K6_ANGAN